MRLADSYLDAGMVDVATFSRARVFFHGLLSFFGWFLAGLLVTGIGCLIASDYLHSSALIGTGVLIVGCGGLVFGVVGGSKIIRSSFRKSCFFRAGPKGLYINLPQYGLFNYRLHEQQIPWNQITDIRHYIFTMGFRSFHDIRISGIGKSGKVSIIRILPRRLFREPIPEIVDKLYFFWNKSSHRPEEVI
jgi:hypothetical protein